MSQINKPLNSRSASGVWHDRNREQIQSQRIVPSADIIPAHSTSGVALFFARKAGGGGGATVTKLIVSDYENGDYLICRAWNEYYWQARRELRTELGAAPTNDQLLTRINTLRDADDLDAWAAADLTTYLAGETIVAKSPELRADEMDGKTIDIEVESWNGTTLSAVTRALSFDYHSATLRTVTDVSSSGTELQTVIPRFIAEETVIHAISSDQVEITVDGDDVRLMDMNIAARAWMKST